MIEVDDIVTLMSGGPPMQVVEVHDTHAEEGQPPGRDLVCVWFDENGWHSDIFDSRTVNKLNYDRA